MLSAYCPKVNLFTLFDKFFAEKFLLERLKTKNNITVTHNMNLIQFVGKDKLEEIVFENTQTKEIIHHKADNIFVAIGQIPDNSRFADLVDIENGYIVTNDDMETKTKGLFAVGDTRKKEVRQVVTALNDGAVAATKALKYLD
jgi:thioredoxin reductase (NADPH)